MLNLKHLSTFASSLGLLFSFSTTSASAHVKWFCAFDVAGQPRGLENVLCSDFELLSGFAILMLTLGYFVEAMPIGVAVLRSLDRVTSGVRENSDLILRAGLGFFFVALWTTGGIILTPELKTASSFIPWLQLFLAACLLWPQTLVVSAAGIVFLFGLALHQYGLFHLMDYPVFLGFAGYLALTGLKRNLFGLRPLDVLRWSAAITLMWASIEKWAYPEWTFGLFVTNPSLLMGFDEEFFMRAAGVVEFALSFALILTPLMRRTSALILLGTFVSAVSGFGKIDAIGHAPIIVAMIAFVADSLGTQQRAETTVFANSTLWKGLGLVPAGFVAALSFFLVSYYVMHSVLFHTSIM